MFVLNSAVPFALNWYFKWTPMFYLPPGDWFGPLGYFFSFPNAPAGAVSSTVWTTVCGRVLALVGAYARELLVKEPQPEAHGREKANRNGCDAGKRRDHQGPVRKNP